MHRKLKILSTFYRHCHKSVACKEVARQKWQKEQEEEAKKPKPKPLTPKQQEQKNREDAVKERFQQKSVRVCIMGADTQLGEMTSFVLKQNPIVSRIYLSGMDSKVKAIAADLNHCDTRCVASAHVDDLPRAVRGADVILMLGSDEGKTDASIDDKLRIEGNMVIERATVCSYFAPRAVLVVCVDPLSVTVPLTRTVFKAGCWYHPGKIIGSVALSQIRANSLVARFQGLDAAYVHVPLAGGPDVDCMLPLFTRARPVGLAPHESNAMLRKFKGLLHDGDLKTSPVPTKLGFCPLSEAYALNSLVTSIGIGICGDDRAIATAYVRTNLLDVCAHLTSTVKFGPNGVVHNFGLPRLYPSELSLFEKSTLLMQKREQIATDFFNTYVSLKEKRLGEAEASRVFSN